MVKICVVGCLHGELDKMYEDVRSTELKYGFKTDLVLCCGDFQSIRNESDLTIMSVPPKYRRLGDFWKYYSSEKTVPYLTVFVGGNHEASNYLQELPYGGWVAPNVYYMGYASVINFHGVRIAGLSGIYKRHDYYTGHFEHAPYDDQSKRTAYHVRNIETFRMKQLKQPVDIVLSHDWPRGVYNYSNELSRLLKEKPHFVDEISNNSLGSPASEEVLVHLQPKYWFAAHLHCKFAARVQFGESGRETRFLALDKCLDKCLSRTDYMQFVDVDPSGTPTDDANLQLDPEWLCVLRATNHLMSISRTTSIMPSQINEERCDFSASETDLKELTELFNNQFQIPDNFETTAPVHNEEYEDVSKMANAVGIYTNPQTDLMCAMLELVNPNAEFLGTSCSVFDLSKKLKMKKDESQVESSSEEEDDGSSCGDQEVCGRDQIRQVAGPDESAVIKAENPDEIKLDEDGDSQSEDQNGDEYDPTDYPDKLSAETDTKESFQAPETEKPNGKPANPDEINIDDEDDEEEEENEADKQEVTQYDPADYPVENSDDEDGYCPSAPFV